MEFKRNSSRSSIRASPAAAIFAIKRKNRYDQLESTLDQGDDVTNDPTAAESNSQYMTLVNQSDEESKHAFENVNFYSALNKSIPSNNNQQPSSTSSDPFIPENQKRKRTPPPIPKRRQSHQSISSNDNKTLKSVHSSIDVVSSSSETNYSRNSYRSHRNSPVPAPLPAPPLNQSRRDSRKGPRKRPQCLDTYGGVGGQIFPNLEAKAVKPISSSLTLDSISTNQETVMLRSSASHEFTQPKLGMADNSNDAAESDDGSSLLIPQLTNSMKIQDEICCVNQNYVQSKTEDDHSDFETIDLVLRNSDDEKNRENIKGSTNNLAEFDNDCEFEHINTAQLPRTYSTDCVSDGTQTPSSDLNIPDFELDPFQTEKLLKNSVDIDPDADNIFNAFVKLPRGRKHRIRGRTMNQVQLSLTSNGLQIFSEDARLIETVNFYSDIQLSNIYIQTINNKVYYFIKLFKVTYKAKKSWGINVRGYSEYLSNDSNFSNYVSRLRPIIKIATRDYSTINLLAKSISNVLAITDKISEDINLMTPSPYCRVVIEAFDDINFLIDTEGNATSSVIETSIRVLTFGTDKLVLAFNDEQTNLTYFEESDLLKPETSEMINPVNIRLHSIIKAATGGYEKQRILKFNPINGAKIEVMRFNMQKNPNTKLPLTLKTEYTIFGSSISITSSLHLNKSENIKQLVIRFPILHSWKEAIKESTFTSITSGSYILEDRALLWKLNDISAVEAKQEFMSVKFNPQKEHLSGKSMNQMKFCQLEFELDDTRLSGTVLRAVSLKTKNTETEKIINYRSYYTLRVGIHFIPEIFS